MKKNLFFIFSTALLLCTGIYFISCGHDDDDTVVTSSIKVSPSVELLGDVNSTTTITVSVSSDCTWSITGAPDWLSFNKSGLGSSTVTITATKENFSDEAREVTLTFTTSDGTASATCLVSQKGVLASNCKVSIGDVTVMQDGFAGDLQFDSNCKGYKHGCFFASELPSLTERDVYNTLMKEDEKQGSLDHFISPYFNPSKYPEAEIIYCIAAYGSETNADGSHKYGPVTMKKIKLKAKTLNCDMYLTLSYTSSTWKVTTSRQGSYGQKCEYYYRIAGDGTDAESLYNNWMGATDAFFTHFYFKPAIEEDPDTYFKNGPQTMTFQRSTNKFCCIVWGTNKDTGEFSSELTGVWYPSTFSSSSTVMKASKLEINENGAITMPQPYTSKKDMPKFNVSIYK